MVQTKYLNFITFKYLEGDYLLLWKSSHLKGQSPWMTLREKDLRPKGSTDLVKVKDQPQGLHGLSEKKIILPIIVNLFDLHANWEN